jgi:hypothetical protein
VRQTLHRLDGLPKAARECSRGNEAGAPSHRLSERGLVTDLVYHYLRRPNWIGGVRDWSLCPGLHQMAVKRISGLPPLHENHTTLHYWISAERELEAALVAARVLHSLASGSQELLSRFRRHFEVSDEDYHTLNLSIAAYSFATSTITTRPPPVEETRPVPRSPPVQSRGPCTPALVSSTPW